jgi:CHAT domain-containing protein
MFISQQERTQSVSKINYLLLQFLDEIKSTLEIDNTSSNTTNNSDELLGNEGLRILFLSANPADTSKLQLDTEFVEIQKILQESPEHDKFDLKLDTNITPNKLHQAIQKYRPNIFHFSGHGFGTGEMKETNRSVEKPPLLSGLIIEDEKGNRKALSQAALDGLFELVAAEANVQVVILNACYSAEQASTIKKYVKNVIGMIDSIGDKSAIAFATGFYRALANGKNIEMSYKYGKNAIALAGFNEEHKVILV